MKTLLIGALAILIALPCCIGPHYKRPRVAVPDSFKEQKDVSERVIIAEWWRCFKDPYLNKLIDHALTHNYDLRIALEQIEYTRDMYKVEFANFFPQIYAVSYINDRRYPKSVVNNQQLPKNTLSYFQLGFDSYWELDIWGQLRHGVNAAYNDYEAQIEAMHSIRLMLISEVAKTYIDIKALQREIDLAENIVTINMRLLALSQYRFGSGLASDVPNAEQQEALDTAQNKLLALRTALTQSTNKLAVLLSENPEDFNLHDGPHDVPISTKKLEVGLPSELLLRRPDIRQAERLLAAATERVGQQRGELFPKFFLLGNTSTQSTYGSNWFGSKSLAWTIGSLVLWPLITFGRVSYKIKATEAKEREALLVYCQQVVLALADVENALVNYFNTEKQLCLLLDQANAATRKRNLTFDLFNSGLKNETDYLIAEQERINIISSLIDTERAFSTALIAVYKALGGGW